MNVLNEGSFTNFRYILTNDKINKLSKVEDLKKKGITIRSAYYENGRIVFNFDFDKPVIMQYLRNNISNDYNGSMSDFPEYASAYKNFSDEYLDPRAEDINRYSKDSRKWGELKNFIYGNSWNYKGIPKKWQEKINNIIEPFTNNASLAIIKDMLKDKKYRDHIVNLRSKMEDIKANGENFLGSKTKPFTTEERKQHRKASFSVKTNYFPY